MLVDSGSLGADAPQFLGLGPPREGWLGQGARAVRGHSGGAVRSGPRELGRVAATSGEPGGVQPLLLEWDRDGSPRGLAGGPRAQTPTVLSFQVS